MAIGDRLRYCLGKTVGNRHEHNATRHTEDTETLQFQCRVCTKKVCGEI